QPFHIYNREEQRFPALWLGIVGRNGIWPVQAFKIENSSKAINDQSEITTYSLPVPAKPLPPGVSPKLGLSGNYWSPTGIGLLLLIGTVCLILPLAFLAQLILYWGRSKVDKANPDRWREGRSKLSVAIIDRILRIERRIKEGDEATALRPLALVRRRWLGQVFGDEEFYCYRLDRRIYLTSCCVSLLTVTLFISGVTFMLARMQWYGGARKTWWDQRLALGLMAGVILVITLIAFIWLVISILKWM